MDKSTREVGTTETREKLDSAFYKWWANTPPPAETYIYETVKSAFYAGARSHQSEVPRELPPDLHMLLHNLRNPYGRAVGAMRRDRLAAADIIDRYILGSNAALASPVEGDRKDAERYRYIREPGSKLPPHWALQWGEPLDETLDALIDAAKDRG